MNDCCKNKGVPEFKKKELCPRCNEAQNITSYQTVLHHLAQPYSHALSEDNGYYFCKNNQCDVVYFDTKGTLFELGDVRGKIGEKDHSPKRQICYCFDVTFDQVEAEIEEHGFSSIKEFVKSQTKLKNCACEIRNPTGKCCLINFPKG